MKRQWSRRGLCLAAAATPFMAESALAQVVNTQAPVFLFDDNANEDPSVISARKDAANRLTLPVMINNQGPFRFVVDTGAQSSIIGENVASALSLPLGQTVVVDGFSKRVDAPLAYVDALSFGHFEFTDLDIPVLSSGPLGADGYLGMDVLSHKRISFDFKRSTIHIETPDAPPERPEAGVTSISVRAADRYGRLHVSHCSVDSVPAVAVIDTGAEISVGNPSLKRAIQGRNKRMYVMGNATLVGVTGGRIEGEVIPVGRIRMHNLSFNKGTLVIADVPEFALWRASSRPSLLIGMDYLRQFSKVVLDFTSGTIRFDLAQDIPLPTHDLQIASLT